MSSYVHITTNTTTVVSAVPVSLNAVIVNSKGATSNTVTLYDHASAASGNVIAVIDTTSVPGDTNYYKLKTTKGLVAVTANGTAADITIVWE